MERFLLTFIFLFSLLTGETPASNTKLTIEPADSVDMLSAFSAGIKDRKIHLVWKIINPREISYFYVLRLNQGDNSYVPVNNNKITVTDFFEKGSDPNSLREYMYSYEDEPKTDGVYYYRLRAYSSKAELVFESDAIKIGISGIRDFVLDQNYPNPFNPTTTIGYELLENSHVTIKVYDLIGKEVTTLIDKYQNAGKYTADFDASKFQNLTSGIYFYKLETEKYSDVKKMILNK